jgi:hypothetical protein
MSELAVPDHQNRNTSGYNPALNEGSDLEDSLHTTTSLTHENPEILLRESKSQGMFLTKTAGLFIVYTGFFVGVNLMIIFSMVQAKILYRSMNMETMTWVFLGIAAFLKILASFGNRFLKKIQMVLFFLDCILSSFVFFGMFWFFETTNSNAYEYSGHYIIISGFCFCAMSFGYLFSTLIRVKNAIYSVPAGLIFMNIFSAGALLIVYSIWTIHTMKFFQYFMMWMWCFVMSAYIALNSSYIMKHRLEKYYDNEIFYCFFCFSTDWFTMFWVDMCKSCFSKKPKKKSRHKKNTRSRIDNA